MKYNNNIEFGEAKLQAYDADVNVRGRPKDVCSSNMVANLEKQKYAIVESLILYSSACSDGQMPLSLFGLREQQGGKYFFQMQTMH